ncbi:hypothetical protein B0H11DRAFT_2189343 [Mycena galericulata]|nr:hypothetical protein B0H11DRAFT_2189343 [Mycena galericulata]
MFSFPQPSNSNLVEGCPIVHLHDAATDVIVFLKAILDPEFFKPFPARTEIGVILGCLRLGSKYEVDYLRRRALIHLSSAYCTKLSRWETADNELDENSAVSNVISWPWPDEYGFSFVVIDLVRKVGALWLLPDAFYSLARECALYDKRVHHGAVYKGVTVRLGDNDLDSFVRGQEIQAQSTVFDILQFLSDPLDIDGCTSPRRCFTVRLKAIKESRARIRRRLYAPLTAWQDWHLLQDVCGRCLAVLKDTHQAARQEFWDHLPEIYGLPPWENLEEMKTAAIGTDWFS